MADITFDATKVDLVSLSPDRSTVLLHIINDQGWSGSDEQLTSLQDKVQTYVSYALDGKLNADYPQTDGLDWCIVINCRAGTPDPRTTFVLDQLASGIQHHGGALRVEIA